MTIGSEKVGPEGVGQYARQASLESSVWYMGGLFGILAASEDTNGQFGLLEIMAPKGIEPPPHIHHREDESFYLLEGNVTFYVGDETFFEAMEPFFEKGVYVNNLGEEGEEGEDRVKEAYGENHERLVALKDKYDPKNLFRLNQNVRPMAQSGAPS